MKLSEVNINYPKETNISLWVDSYLRGIGDNVPMADGLISTQRFWFGTLILPLDILHRCCGPEDTMEYKIPIESFNGTVDKVAMFFVEGKQMEPLICQYRNGALSIRDGNHRVEALKKLGLNSYYILIRADSLKEYAECTDYISNCLSLRKLDD